MLEKVKSEKAYNILTILVLIIVTIFMFYWIGEKDGFHEDEIFSYGSSNYKWDNLFQAAAKSDYVGRAIEKYIITDDIGETIKNAVYYIIHQDEFSEKATAIQSEDKPIWKTSKDAKEYVTIGEGDIFNYISVYYNQSRDVHPPLFYMLVHLASSIAYGIFSKYIIFTINLVFILLTCYIIRKIFILFNKKYLGLIAILFYGLSMGAASTAIFLRMYAMLTFFCLLYLYLNLRILKHNLEITKRDKWKLFFTVLLGFLTQYYFCIFALFIFILMCIKMIYNKEYITIRRYILTHFVTAIVGVILFPMSIQHIFLSYRGIGAEGNGLSLIDGLQFYLVVLSEGFSINNVLMFIVIALALIGIITTIIIKKVNKQKIEKLYQYVLLIVPTILYFIYVAKMAPSVEAKYAIRYLMPILPEIVIIFVLGVYRIFKNKKISYILTICITLAITINGMITNKPKYLYYGYSNYLEVAEEYKDLDFIYAVDNAFTYISSLPEFMIYNKTLILNMNYDSLDFLTTDEELQSQDEFVLSIKKWMNVEEVLNQILEYSGFSNYEVLLDQEDDTQSIIYLISR